MDAGSGWLYHCSSAAGDTTDLTGSGLSALDITVERVNFSPTKSKIITPGWILLYKYQ